MTRFDLLSWFLALGMAWALAVAAGSVSAAEPGVTTRPLAEALDADRAGPCIDEAELVGAVAEWLRTDRVDERIRVLVTHRERPGPTVSFWVWRGDEAIGERHFAVGNASCAELTSALALAIALAIDATVLDMVSERPSEAPEPPEPPERVEEPRAEGEPVGESTDRVDPAAVWVSAGGLASSGGLGPAFTAGLGALVRPVSPLAVEGELLLTPVAAEVRAEPGDARLRLLGARMFALAEPWAAGRVSPAFGVGAGTWHAWGEGSADSPEQRASRDGTTVAALAGRARLIARFSPGFLLLVGADAGYSLPQLVIRGDTVSSSPLLRPFADFQLGVGVRLP